MKQKKSLSEKESNVDRQKWACPACKELSKRVKQIGSFVEYVQYGWMKIVVLMSTFLCE